MIRPIITVPDRLLREAEMNWDIDWGAQSSGQATDGNYGAVFNAFPRWVGAPRGFLAHDAIPKWRAIRAQAQGRLGIYRMKMLDPLGFAVATETVSFEDEATFSDNATFRYTPFAINQGAKAAGATTLRVSTTQLGIAPKQGQIMSHNDWPFQITSIEEVSASVYDLTIQMPLRAAIADGDPVYMEAFGLFEIAEDMVGNPAYGASRVSQISLSFREVLRR